VLPGCLAAECVYPRQPIYRKGKKQMIEKRELTVVQRMLQNDELLDNVLTAIENQETMVRLFNENFTYNEAAEFIRTCKVK
jgi:hypothetical protein